MNIQFFGGRQEKGNGIILYTMYAIDKASIAYLRAEDAIVQRDINDMEEPSDASVNQGVNATRRRSRPEEVQYFLKANTLSIIERLHNIATDTLYTRDEKGERQRIFVPAGVQLQAANGFLDRAMGKPQVNVDLTSGDRPIMFDAAFQARPLVQASIDTIENETIVPNDDED